jgi:broad specificity phosphatase PhoE
MTTIYLARHGQDADNAAGLLNGWRNTCLTPLGFQQARILANNLADKGIERIVCSPLNRACQTAAVVARRLLLDFYPMADLIERNYGDFTGRPVADIPRLMAEWHLMDQLLTVGNWNIFLNGPKVETFPRVLVRAKKVLVHVEKFPGPENILLVCHTDIMKMITAAFYERPWPEVLKEGNIANTEFVVLER